MPISTSSICRCCSKRTVNGSYCADHSEAGQKQENDAARSNLLHRQLYRTARWYSVRQVVLHRDILCVKCKSHAATVCDHHPIEGIDIVRLHGKDEFFNPARLRGVCKHCHDIKTAVKTGFARPK